MLEKSNINLHPFCYENIYYDLHTQIIKKDKHLLRQFVKKDKRVFVKVPVCSVYSLTKLYII